MFYSSLIAAPGNLVRGALGNAYNALTQRASDALSNAGLLPNGPNPAQGGLLAATPYTSSTSAPFLGGTVNLGNPLGSTPGFGLVANAADQVKANPVAGFIHGLTSGTVDNGPANFVTANTPDMSKPENFGMATGPNQGTPIPGGMRPLAPLQGLGSFSFPRIA